MAILKIIAVLATLCLAQKIAAVRNIEGVYWFLWDSERLFEYRFDYSDGRVVYGACRNSLAFNNTIECYISADKSFNQSDKYTCNVTIETVNEKKLEDLDWSIKRLGENKIIIKLSESNTMFAVVQLSDCEISYVQVDDANCLRDRDDLIITYPDSFDVFFKNSKICGSDFCRMTVEGHGRMINGLIGSIENPNKLLAINSVSETSSDQGFFLVSSAGYNIMHNLIRPNASQKLLTKSDIEGYREDETAVSTKYSYITVCSILKSFKRIGGIKRIMSINCTQYDKSGNVKFKTSTVKAIDTYELNQLLFIHNLREGGFMFGFTLVFRSLLMRYQYLTKIDSTGNQVGKSIMEKVSDSQWYSLFQDKNSELCVFKTSTSNARSEWNRREFVHACYDDSDFIQRGSVGQDGTINSKQYPLDFEFFPIVTSAPDTAELNHSS